MEEGRLSLRVARFQAIQEEIRLASRSRADAEPCDQVRYLESYLRKHEEPARTLVVEWPYVDRHYLEEYSGYYATELRPPSTKTTRLHVFSRDFEQDDFDAWLNLAATAGPESAEAQMQPSYMGFIVVRPIPGAPIGRTVLAPYAEKNGRVLVPAETEHRIHLCGLDLKVRGVPFQQQDQAVGACATTALWSALARVMRADGARAVTPLAVTSAATQRIEAGRAFPAISGLELPQMLDAIRAFGYSPHLFEPASERAIFQLALKCYLRSGIPVILELHYDTKPLERHAVTVVGFREAAIKEDRQDQGDDSSKGTPGELRRRAETETGSTAPTDRESDAVTATVADGADELYAEDLVFKRDGVTYGVRSAGITRLYTHDDRFGPYARMVWLPQPEGDSFPRVRFAPKEKGFERYEKPATIYNALVPLYPKLRLTATDMVEVAAELLPLMRQVAGKDFRDSVTLDMRYVLSGRYLRELFASKVIDAPRLAEFASTAVLSRYVGLLHFKINGQMFVDVVCDTTDLLRAQPLWAPVLAMLARYPGHAEGLKDFCRHRGFPALLV